MGTKMSSMYQVLSSRHVNIYVFLVFSLISSEVFSQTNTENYIKTTTYKVETTSSISSPSAEQATVEIIYSDGLGRAKQAISHRQSGNGDDLITHMEYDGFGRQVKEFLPYERSASLQMDGSASANVLSFYNVPEFDSTGNPFSEKELEASPLNRVLKQAAPGNKWAMGSGHEVKYSYETNNTNEVYHFTVSLEGTNPALNYEGYYPVQQLYKTITKDENWQVSNGNKGVQILFKDKMGRVVLKRLYDIPIGASRNSGDTILIDTYYVYDDYGNLAFVLSPKLSTQIVSGSSLAGNHQMLLDELGYQYRYDFRDRVIEKKIPGKHWEYIVYDAIDRVTATGPSLSPFGDGQEGWLHTKYDIHNRVAYTLWKQGTVNGAQRQSMSATSSNPISENRITGTTTINGVDFSYSNVVSPTSGYHVLTVEYYDDYEYTGAPSTIPTTVGEGDSDVYYDNASQKPKGLPTGNWARVLEMASVQDGITSHVLYDDKSREIRNESNYPNGGFTQLDSKYDFIGNTEYIITTNKKDNGATALTVKDSYTYDDQERLTLHKHQIESLPEQLISFNTYDALGRTIETKVGGTDVSGASGFQHVNYSYNVRNWLTDINNTSYLPQSGDPLDLFALKINYTTVDDDINGNVTPLYNGNIAETFWRTSSDNIKRKYGYTYDYQDRLRDAWYQLPNSSTPEYFSYNENISYDRNGNILSLQRNGELESATTIVAIDDLDYSYDDGNKLLNVVDAENHPAGFNDGNISMSQDDFEYDTYGNLILDRNKGITAITYNHLNLPKLVTFGSLGTIEYLYDAAGIKLKKTVVDGSITKVTDYMDGFQYTAGDLDFFPHAEGYVKVVPPSGLGGQPSYNYVFNYTDHLGNIRLRYALDPQTNDLTILEEDHYYPFGLKQKGYNTVQSGFSREPGGTITLTPINPFLGSTYKYKFGGKEYSDELGLNIYDFGARNYDAALGRWMNVDPLTEDMWTHSPYNYAFNNPIYYVDPDGNMPFPNLHDALNNIENFVNDTNAIIDANWKRVDINLDEAVVTAQKEPEGTDDGTPVWGLYSADRGVKEGSRRGDFDMTEMPTTVNPAGLRTGSGLMNLLRYIIAILSRDRKVDKEMESNRSTMENNEYEPITPPEEEKKHFLYIHESFKGSDGRRHPSRYNNANGEYGAPTDKNLYKSLDSIRVDSAKQAEFKVNPSNPSHRIDSITIESMPVSRINKRTKKG